MTAYLEMVLLVAFVVSATGLLITGVVHLALRLAALRPERAPDGQARAREDISTRADEASSAERRK